MVKKILVGMVCLFVLGGCASKSIEGIEIYKLDDVMGNDVIMIKEKDYDTFLALVEDLDIKSKGKGQWDYKSATLNIVRDGYLDNYQFHENGNIIYQTSGSKFSYHTVNEEVAKKAIQLIEEYK